MPSRYASPVHLRAEDLACRRGGRLVFEHVGFTLGEGELMALTGPNGSGKTSILRMVAGLIRPEAGTLTFDARQDGGGSNGRLHYLGHFDALKPSLTLAETLAFWATLSSASTSGSDRQTNAADAVGLGHALDLPVGILSAGQRRRAGLARLLVAPQPLWLLDEPASALDAAGETLLGNLMRQHLQAGGSIMAATHGPLPHPPTAILQFADPA